MITNWVQQLGWTKPPAVLKQVETVAQTASAGGAPNASTAPSLDGTQMQQMTQGLATLRQTVEHLAAGQDQVKREIVRMESSLIDILVKIPEPLQPPVAPARKPMPAPPPTSSRAPTTAPHP
jgi:hypothetical protein